jgi:hypothetical protein
MQPVSIQVPPATAEHAIRVDHGATRLRTVTGNRWPRKCSCGCGGQMPRDAALG